VNWHKPLEILGGGKIWAISSDTSVAAACATPVARRSSPADDAGDRKLTPVTRGLGSRVMRLGWL
jgi:hypothetical protein